MLRNQFKRKCNEFPEQPEINKIPREEYDLFVVNEVDLEDNHYTIKQKDSNTYVVFNEENDVVIHIPDGLYKGTGVIFANVGSGSLQVVEDGTETYRGLKLLSDGDSFLTMIKITDSIWQGSERE